jgi:hypothetical protein
MKRGVLTRTRLLALGLWLVLAIVVWNSIFDEAVNEAAHRYIEAATEAARAGQPLVSMDAIMRPAIAHGAWTATAWGVLTLAVGVAGLVWSVRRERRTRTSRLNTCSTR